MKKVIFSILLTVTASVFLVACQESKSNKTNTDSTITNVSKVESKESTKESTDVTDSTVTKTDKELKLKREEAKKPVYQGKISKEKFDQLFSLNQYLVSYKVFVSSGDIEGLRLAMNNMPESVITDQKLLDIYNQFIDLCNQTIDEFDSGQLTPEKMGLHLRDVGQWIGQVRGMSNGAF